MTAPTTVDAYIESAPPAAQADLRTMRQTIRGVLPEAEEAISYAIPTFKVGGKPVVYFAGYKGHVSLYPIPHDDALESRMAPYRAGKGTLRFKLGQPLPTELIEDVVRALAGRPQA